MFAIVYRTGPSFYIKLGTPRKTRPNAAAVAHRAMEFCNNTGTYPKRVMPNGPIAVMRFDTVRGINERIGTIQVEQV